jgi:hypothetical protein
LLLTSSPLRGFLQQGCLLPDRLFRALLRAGTGRPGIAGEELIPLDGHCHGEDGQRENADADRQVHQQQAASSHSTDEHPDRDYD